MRLLLVNAHVVDDVELLEVVRHRGWKGRYSAAPGGIERGDASDSSRRGWAGPRDVAVHAVWDRAGDDGDISNVVHVDVPVGRNAVILDERGVALRARRPELEGVEGTRDRLVVAVVADEGAVRVHRHV